MTCLILLNGALATAACSFSSDDLIMTAGDQSIEEIEEQSTLLKRAGALNVCKIERKEKIFLITTWPVIGKPNTFRTVTVYDLPQSGYQGQKFVWDVSATGKIYCYLEDSKRPGYGRQNSTAVDSSHCMK